MVIEAPGADPGCPHVLLEQEESDTAATDYPWSKVLHKCQMATPSPPQTVIKYRPIIKHV